MTESFTSPVVREEGPPEEHGETAEEEQNDLSVWSIVSLNQAIPSMWTGRVW
jgi:hypothetical protein